MKVHEYQAKEVLQALNIQIPRMVLVSTPDEAKKAAALFSKGCVVKAQVHSGERGKAGGVIVCSDPEEAYEAAKKLIGNRLFTKQSGLDGLYIPAVLVTEKTEIERELYLAVTVDSTSLRYVVIASSCGGMEIEEVAKSDPDQIICVYIPPYETVKPYQIQYLSDRLNLNKNQASQLANILESGFSYMIAKDASLIEINPLACVGDSLVAVDAKITFDDNALYRHPEIKAMNDLTQIDRLESEARKIGLEYVKLKGNIACLVNGAGLAMATMDIIKSYGGEPANFMDIGGGAGMEKVMAAFGLIMKDKSVKSIFVNVFGGIARCDVIAEGIVQATKKTGLSIPLVVRLRGTHEVEGREILNQSGLDIISIEDFREAAKQAVACAGGTM